MAIKQQLKGGSAVRDLGCTIPQLKMYLEANFKPGMSWENYGYGKGKWNIDHIRPLASFDLTNHQHVREACWFGNLQPLWHEENQHKGATWAAAREDV